MVKSTRRETKGKAVRRTTSSDHAPQPQYPELTPTHLQRTVDLTRSALQKGLHDTLATIFRAGIITLATVTVSWVGLHYFGYEIDLRGWLAGKPMITGSTKPSIPEAVPDLGTMNRLVDCKVNRQRAIDRLIDRRKHAWALHSKCKAEWKPAPSSAQTADEACASDLVRYRALAKEVTEREAKDDCAAPNLK